VVLQASSWAEATTATNNILVTTTMDRQAVQVDLQAWPAHSSVAAAATPNSSTRAATSMVRPVDLVAWVRSLVVAALPTTAINQDSKVTTRATVPAASSSMALLKATVAAVAVDSSATSWVAMTSRAVAVATATRQAAVPAVHTLVLHPRLPTSHLVRHPRAMALILVALIRVHRHRAMARSMAHHRHKATVRSTAPHRRKAMAHNMAPHRRASALNPGHTTRQVATSDSSHLAASNQAPTVVHHPNTADTVKAATAVKADLVATNSLRADIHKADTAVRRPQAGMAAVDMSSRMATAVTEGDVFSCCLDIDRQTDRQTGMVFCKRRSLMTVYEFDCVHELKFHPCFQPSSPLSVRT
jgi:hypothetical protein